MVSSPWKSVWCCWMSHCDKFLRMYLMLVSHKLIRQSCMRCRLGETLLKNPIKSPQVQSFCRYSMWLEHICMSLMISYMIQFYPSNVEQFTNPQLPKSLNATWFFSDELSDKDWTKDFGSGTILVKPEICKCTTTVSIETSNQMHWQLPKSTQQWPHLMSHQPWWGRYISCL